MSLSIRPTEIKGAWIGQFLRREDERGHFSRLFCTDELKDYLLPTHNSIENINTSLNLKSGTLRGIHYQVGDSAETKIVYCTSGRIYDVAVDLRRDSSTFMKHISVTLDEHSAEFLIVPPGCGHAYQTLRDSSVVTYFVTRHYSPRFEKNINPYDKILDIHWPVSPGILSERDKNAPSLSQ